jgi:hypothetical protein
MPMPDDADPDALISRLAGPLSPPDRAAFRRAAEDALTRVPCWGEGAVYRAVAGCSEPISAHPTIDECCGIFHRSFPGAASSRRRRRSGGTIPAVAVALARSGRLNGENAAELNECR